MFTEVKATECTLKSNIQYQNLLWQKANILLPPTFAMSSSIFSFMRA